jgi:hypothetical protein
LIGKLISALPENTPGTGSMAMANVSSFSAVNYPDRMRSI